MKLNTNNGIIDTIQKALGQEQLSIKDSNKIIRYYQEHREESYEMIEALLTYHTGAFLEYVDKLLKRIEDGK